MDKLDMQPDIVAGNYSFDTLQSGIRFHGGRMQATQNLTHCCLVQPYVAFVLLLEGRICFQFGKQPYEISAGRNGRCLLITIHHVDIFNRHLFAQESVVKLTIAGLERWLPTPTPMLYAEKVRHWKLQKHLRQQAEIILHEQTSHNQHNPLKKEADCIGLLHACWQAYGLPLLDKPVPGNTSEVPADNDKLALEKKLNTALAKGLTEASQVADFLHVSERTLRRQINKQFACTAQQWLQNARMQRALQALGEEQLSIGETAYLCGYRHPSNFIQAFHKHFGVTPGSLRQKHAGRNFA